MIKINKILKSRIESVDFDNLVFGKTFTDHMFICHFKNGSWLDPEIKPYQPIKIEPSASVFHYGQAVFEGMKAYKDNDGKVWLFRPNENFKRINRSSHRLQIPEFPEEYFFEGLNQLIKEGYDLLNLDTFFTSGPEESRAWTVEKNTLAPKAASVIHTDFEKNFIRAEAVTCEDFIKFGSAEKCKENGKLRIEGKDYIVKDGDVLYFRVNP